jgi:lantibiotic biosynthesis protein
VKTPTHTAVAECLAQQQAVLETFPAEQRQFAQSLAKGAAGIALLHIERAHVEAGSWQTAHNWIAAAVTSEISAAGNIGLYFGAPAISFALHAAQADGSPRYTLALAGVDPYVTALTHHRVDHAQARIDRGDLATFAEYDLFYGLTGIGAHLLQHAPSSDVLGRVLAYLVRLTKPLRTDAETLPGWWVSHDPNVKHSKEFPGGHANLGIAHGITGPLALLSQALRRGVTVDGHLDAINTICTWLDTWQQNSDTSPWWPQWITRDQLRTGRPEQLGPLRPSWCYGTPGLARAQQLSAIATLDTNRQSMAERALAKCLSDPAQLDRITGTSLCHGWAGLYQTTWRAARDALTPELSANLPHLTEHLTRHCHAGQAKSTGLLEGATGLALALHTAAHTTSPTSGWDACLLIN